MPARGRTGASPSPRSLFSAHGHAHFHALANALSAIGGLIRRRPTVAEELLAEVTGYLRALALPRRYLVTLADDVQLALALLAVQRARLGSRLRVEIAIRRDAVDVLIPPFVVQALVENAVAHGISRRPEGGTIRIAARVSRGILCIAVTDDGLGLRRSPNGGVRAGGGLSGIRARLAALWGHRARLRLLTRPSAGTLAALTLPATQAPPNDRSA